MGERQRLELWIKCWRGPLTGSELWSSGRIRGTNMATEVTGTKWWPSRGGSSWHWSRIPSLAPFSCPVLAVCVLALRAWLALWEEPWGSGVREMVQSQHRSAGFNAHSTHITVTGELGKNGYEGSHTSHLISSIAAHLWKGPQAVIKRAHIYVYLVSMFVYIDFKMDLCSSEKKALISSALSNLS